MPTLRELQRSFVADLLGDSDKATAFIEEGAFPAARLQQIHRNNLYISLGDALAAIYPVVQRLVGGEFFAFAARRFVRDHPPRSGNLHDFGAAFPAFLDQFEPAADLPYLGDEARLEWACHRAFHAADHAPFDPRRLAAIPPAQFAGLGFVLHPSASVLRSDYPIGRIREANLVDDEVPVIDLAAGGETLLVRRPRLRVEVKRLAPAEGAWLDRLSAGGTLASAAEAAWAVDAGFALDGALQTHVNQGTLVDVLLGAAGHAAVHDA